MLFTHFSLILSQRHAFVARFCALFGVLQVALHNRVIFIYPFSKLVYSFFMHFQANFFVTVAQFWGSFFYILTFCTNLTTIPLGASSWRSIFSLNFHITCSIPINSLLFYLGACGCLCAILAHISTYFAFPSCIFRGFVVYWYQYVTGGFYAIWTL